jgi:hypothetical protein
MRKPNKFIIKRWAKTPIFTWVKIGLLVFKPSITKFDICWFSNWKLNWKPIKNQAPFESNPTLERTSNKSTFLWNFHIFENHNYIMPKLIFWKVEIWWVNGHIPKLLFNRYISLLLGTTQIDLCLLFCILLNISSFPFIVWVFDYIHATSYQKLIMFTKACDKEIFFCFDVQHFKSKLDFMVTNEWFARISSTKRSVRYLISFPSYAIFGLIAILMLY